MRFSLLSALSAALLTARLVTAGEYGPSATVDLRIEAQTKTIFEGKVTTRGHNITTKEGGTHACDATSQYGIPIGPAPNVVSALDDAAAAGHYTWDGQYVSDESSFEVDRISNASSTHDNYVHWAYSVDYNEYDTAGCTTVVKNGSSIVFVQTTNVSTGLNYLDLSGPETVTAGKPFKVYVKQGNTVANETMAPVKGALVKNSVTNSKGQASVTLYRKGTYSFKSTKPNWVRSNALTVNVV